MSHDVVIDTSLDPPVYISRVYTILENGTYGVGQEIPVTVVFSAPVRLCLGGETVHYDVRQILFRQTQ